MDKNEMTLDGYMRIRKTDNSPKECDILDPDDQYPRPMTAEEIAKHTARGEADD